MKKGFQMNDTLPSRQEVLDRIFSQWDFENGTEVISVEEALDRVPAEDLFSKNTIPPVRTSALDGIAVKSEYFRDGMPDTTEWKCGDEFVRADTGDDFPDEYDAVIRIEFVEIDKDNKVEILKDMEVKPGTGVKPVGSVICEGEKVVDKGRKLSPLDLSALVMGGISAVRVYRKPRVAFIPTGNELVDPGKTPGRGQTVNSNSILAKNLLIRMGAEPIIFPIVKDNKKNLEPVFREAQSQADLVIINGGSSMGGEDFNAQFLKENGEVLIHGVAAGPGKPVCVAEIDQKPVVNVPGPPIALFYVMDWCIRPMISRMLHIPVPKRQKVEGILADDFRTPRKNEKLSMMNISRDEEGGFEIHPFLQGKNSVAENLRADALYVSEPEGGEIKAGEKILVELLRGEEYL